MVQGLKRNLGGGLKLKSGKSDPENESYILSFPRNSSSDPSAPISLSESLCKGNRRIWYSFHCVDWKIMIQSLCGYTSNSIRRNSQSIVVDRNFNPDLWSISSIILFMLLRYQLKERFIFHKVSTKDWCCCKYWKVYIYKKEKCGDDAIF